MRVTVVYGFDSGQLANRFLNRLKSGEVPGVKAHLHRGSDSVAAVYSLTAKDGFDATCSQLDDLAATLGGREITP
ncbi:hypothetical protein [Pseudomaricurvus sp. HS19]|uniref:hypothetical protein n=1 Tax=Pseudomaricurvus sp. HS19 TaxID=2692626 RepID=UPI0013722839|nr:hypothetical protein [Pseudomaricurvus sp. HS19]MYM62063.1 hypothetical protein [Pseudomaricurvus sp. HS19]